MNEDLVPFVDLQHIYQRKALEAAGMPEATEYLMHAKRYRKLYDEIVRLRTQLVDIELILRNELDKADNVGKVLLLQRILKRAGYTHGETTTAVQAPKEDDSTLR